MILILLQEIIQLPFSVLLRNFRSGNKPEEFLTTKNTEEAQSYTENFVSPMYLINRTNHLGAFVPLAEGDEARFIGPEGVTYPHQSKLLSKTVHAFYQQSVANQKERGIFRFLIIERRKMTRNVTEIKTEIKNSKNLQYSGMTMYCKFLL
jgi:hypothetical protein